MCHYAYRNRLTSYEVNHYRQSWLHIHTHIQSCREYCRRILLRAIIHEDAFRLEENGRTGSRPLGLSGLSRLANRGRDYDAIRFSPCCRPAYAVGNTGLPAKTSLSERISAPCSESYFRRNGTHVRKLARSTLSSGNVATSYKYGVQMRLPVITSVDLWCLFGHNFRYNSVTIPCQDSITFSVYITNDTIYIGLQNNFCQDLIALKYYDFYKLQTKILLNIICNSFIVRKGKIVKTIFDKCRAPLLNKRQLRYVTRYFRIYLRQSTLRYALVLKISICAPT